MLVMLKTRCKRCGGNLVENYREINCIQCGEPHDENGERIPTIDPVAIGFSLHSGGSHHQIRVGKA